MAIPSIELAEHLSADALILLLCLSSIGVRCYVQYWNHFNLSLFFSTICVITATVFLTFIMASEWWIIITAHKIKEELSENPGLSTEDLSPFMFLDRGPRQSALKSMLASRVFYFSGIWAAKLSWLWMFESAAKPQDRIMHYKVWGAFGSLGVTFITNLVLVLFWCGGVSEYWNIRGGKVCLPWHSPSFLTITTALNVLTELHILVVGYQVLCPLSLLRNPQKSKFEATWLVFGVAGVAIIMSLLRAIACFLVYREANHDSHEMEDLGTMFSHLEMMAHIIVACTPAYRVIYQWHRKPQAPPNPEPELPPAEDMNEPTVRPLFCYDLDSGNWVSQKDGDPFRAGSPGPSIRDGSFGGFEGRYGRRYSQDGFEDVDLEGANGIPMRSLQRKQRRLSPISERTEYSTTKSVPMN